MFAEELNNNAKQTKSTTKGRHLDGSIACSLTFFIFFRSTRDAYSSCSWHAAGKPFRWERKKNEEATEVHEGIANN